MKIRSYLVIVSWLLVISQTGYASSLDPLKLGAGARMVAMGRTAVAAAGDMNSIFVNPANTAYINNLGLTSMYTNLSEDISYTFLGGSNSYNYGNFGLAYLGAGSGGFQLTTIEAGRVVGTGGTFDYSSSVLCLTYGKEFYKDLALGASLKFFNKGFSTISGGTGSGYDMDLGIIWKPQPDLTIGLSQQNTLPSSIAAINWGTGAKEGIPFNTKLGLSYIVRNGLLLAADMDYAQNNPLVLHGGVEWEPLKWLAIRGGIDQVPTSSSQTSTNYTIGIGLNYSGFSFDYAYYYDTLLSSANSAHFFSLSYQMFPPGVEKKIEKARPSMRKKNFSDVPAGYWAEEPIGILGALGIISGYPDGTFKPENKITRAEFTALLVKAREKEVEKPETALFPDLPAAHWASGYVAKALQMRWIKGYTDGSFKPNNEISRAEGVSIISRFDQLEIKNVTGSPFQGMAATHWAAAAVQAAKNAGILIYLQGKDLEPNRTLTRAEVAEMLYRTSFIRQLLPR
jgi:hypothetical protein